MTPAHSTWLRPTLAAMVGVVIAVGAAELLTRARGLTSDEPFEFDPAIGVRHVPGATGRWRSAEYDTPFRINALGFRDPERSPAKPAGTRRVVVLGDSITEGLQVDGAATFPSVLEASLRESRENVEVINLGVSSLGTSQELRLLERDGFPLQPDVVVLAFFTGNDLRNNHVALNRDPGLTYPVTDAAGHLSRVAGRLQFTAPEERSRLRRFLSAYSALFRLVRSVVAQRRATAAAGEAAVADFGMYKRHWAPDWDVALTTTCELVDEMNHEVSRHHGRLLVVVIPGSWEVSEAWRRRTGLIGEVWDVGVAERRVRACLAERSIDVVSVTRPLLQPDTFFPVDGHLTVTGHRVIAEAVKGELASRLQHADIDRRLPDPLQ